MRKSAPLRRQTAKFRRELGGDGDYSFDTTSLSDIDATVAAIMIAATAVKPTTYDPENSFSQPIMDGPTKPPTVPMLLMNARPPAAATPVRNRVGMVQQVARAAVTPTKTTL